MIKIDSMNYQELLNSKYNGTVKHTERFVSPQAVIFHHCQECNNGFYGKPLYMINKLNKSHVCGEVVLDQPVPRSTRARMTELKKQQMIQLIKQGKGVRQIARQLGVSSGTVSYHLKKACMH